ncbi:MAG TPA: hypothetical protein VJX72_11510 [Candidatus Acidoferrum sp.]|nr:hypothetical protein [Candidatus Acidoferrum sp.]
MRACWVSFIAALAAGATLLIEPSSAVAQSPAEVPTNSSFAGTWEGKMNDLPGIDLKIEAKGGNISGTIVFYYQERSNADEPWHVAGEAPTPLLAPLVEGRTLTFEVQRHKCHGCTELIPNVKLRMELTGPNEARLWKLENQDTNKDLGPGLKLVRQPESAPSPKPGKGSE